MSVCYKCPERKKDCHSKCEKYAAEVAENKKRIEEAKKDRESREALHSPAFQRRGRDFLNRMK